MQDQVPVPPPPSEKKGIPVLGWVGIGCGTLLILAIVVISLLIGWCKRTVGDFSEFQRNPEKATAEMIVRLQPGIKLLTQDEAKGEMTLRLEDGREVTMSYQDVAAGKFALPPGQTGDLPMATEDLSKLPSWVPLAPGLKPGASLTLTEKDGQVSGVFSAASDRSPEEIAGFLSTETEKLGSGTYSNQSTTVNGAESRNFSVDRGGRKIDAVLTRQPGEDTRILLQFEGPR